MNDLWPVLIAEAVRDYCIRDESDPEWHGGERAAQAIADLLRACPQMPRLTPTMLSVLRVLREKRGPAGEEEVVITEFRGGSASVAWITGDDVQSMTVLPSTLRKLKTLGLVESRGSWNGAERYGLSISGSLVSQIYEEEK